MKYSQLDLTDRLLARKGYPPRELVENEYYYFQLRGIKRVTALGIRICTHWLQLLSHQYPQQAHCTTRSK